MLILEDLLSNGSYDFPHLVVIEGDTKRVVAHVFGIASRNITDCHLREEQEEAEEEAPWL